MKLNNNVSIQDNGRNTVFMSNGKITINDIIYTVPKSKTGSISQTMVGDNIYINGYEFKNGKFKRTFWSLFHWFF